MLKLENKEQRIADTGTFVIRLGKYTLLGGILIAVSLIIGVLGYHYIGHVSWLDSFHMSCMILTGMGPVVEMTSNAGKMFSSFYALYSGIAFLSSTAVFAAPIIHRIMHILHVPYED